MPRERERQRETERDRDRQTDRQTGRQADRGKRIGREIRKLLVFKDGDCTFGARDRKTAGARSCCIPELLALKGLKAN